MKKISLPLLVVAALLTSSANADVIGFEDFDGGAVNLSGTTNVFTYDPTGGGGPGTGGAFGDAFGIVSSVNSGGVGGTFGLWDDTTVDNSGGGIFADDTVGLGATATTAFFGLDDADGASGPGVTFANWSFDVSSATTLTNIQIDIGAMGDFESADGFLIEAQLDGGGFQTIFQGITDEDISKTYRPLEDGNATTLNDPLELFIDGSATGAGLLDKADSITGNFDTFTSTLFAGQSGGTLDIQISFVTASGTEPQGIDNITINGTTIPEPSSIAILAAASLIAVRRRR